MGEFAMILCILIHNIDLQIKVNQCYDYGDISAGRCDIDCQSNSFVRACTDISVPFCYSWTCKCTELYPRGRQG